jgi:hypothetical protein
MSALVAQYIEEVANGRVPSPDSPEARAYRIWSQEQDMKACPLYWEVAMGL